MTSLNQHMQEYKKQLDKGMIQQAYRGLFDFYSALRSYLKEKYPDHLIPGSIYQGYMDMTYFSYSPPILKKKDLKIAIVFLHKPMRFEVWLGAVNRHVQNHYRELFRKKGWDKAPLTEPGKGVDAIVALPLAEHPDFDHQPALMRQIEQGVTEFINDVH